MTLTPNTKPKAIFVADDDPDDRLLFEEAMKQVDETAQLTFAKDGEDLMNLLDKVDSPEIIFIDLNMPRKNGLDCLKEIRRTHAYKDIPVIIFSTSFQQDAIKETYEHDASYYIRKPDSFQKLILSIQQLFAMDWSKILPRPSLKEFTIAL